MKEIKRVADEVKRKTGRNGLDYLVTTQGAFAFALPVKLTSDGAALNAGGPPNGSTSLTSTTPAHDTHFAIQTLSRFGLAYLLASSGTLKDTWISVCAPAGEKGPDPDVEDIELRGEEYRKKWTVQRILGQAKQDSALNDAAAVVSVAFVQSFSLRSYGFEVEKVRCFARDTDALSLRSRLARAAIHSPLPATSGGPPLPRLCLYVSRSDPLTRAIGLSRQHFASSAFVASFEAASHSRDPG